MPRINVSDDVLAAIRALRREAKEPEGRVLGRLLDLHGVGPAPETVGPGNIGGFIDATYGIHFPERFEIFRTYKGRPYAARVAGGRWLLDCDMDTGDRTYDSLNQLSQAVIDGNENAWMFWFFHGPDGAKKRIAELRDPALVQKRPRRNRHRHRQGGERQAVMPAATVELPPPPGPVPGRPRPGSPCPRPRRHRNRQAAAWPGNRRRNPSRSESPLPRTPRLAPT
jgi:hypothetical protein